VTFTAVDMPHSFTIDAYRISKRAAQGQTVTFEFRADRTGPFDFFCNLSQDERCKNMRGKLVVR
jgi:heme/copper-type cytochrome/quinol oxidase subunit 2